jgi:hypothetical protein
VWTGLGDGVERADMLLPRDSGFAKERRGKANEKSLLTRLLVDLAVESKKPRPKVVAAPLVATFPRRRGSGHLEGRWGGETETSRQKELALLPPR